MVSLQFGHLSDEHTTPSSTVTWRKRDFKVNTPRTFANLKLPGEALHGGRYKINDNISDVNMFGKDSRNFALSFTNPYNVPGN